MYQINFKARNLHISKNEEDQYYMIAIADGESTYTNYVIFQKTFDTNELKEESELNGVYIECNGESCYNCCNKIILEKDVLKFEVKGTSFSINFKEISLKDNFHSFMTFIFGDLFINMNNNSDVK